MADQATLDRIREMQQIHLDNHFVVVVSREDLTKLVPMDVIYMSEHGDGKGRYLPLVSVWCDGEEGGISPASAISLDELVKWMTPQS